MALLSKSQNEKEKYGIAFVAIIYINKQIIKAQMLANNIWIQHVDHSTYLLFLGKGITLHNTQGPCTCFNIIKLYKNVGWICASNYTFEVSLWKNIPSVSKKFLLTLLYAPLIYWILYQNTKT